MTTYISKKQRLFQEDLQDVPLPVRPHSKLKACTSVMDSRAWSAHAADRSDYLLDLIKRNDKCPDSIPSEVIIDTLVAKKTEEINALKKKMKELERIIATYESLHLTPEQRAFVDEVKGKIANQEIVSDDDGSSRTGYGTARSGPSTGKPDTLSKEKLKVYLLNKDKDIAEIHRQVDVIHTAITSDCGLREYISYPPEIPDDLEIYEKILRKIHVVRTFVNGVAGGELVDRVEATVGIGGAVEHCVPDISSAPGGSGVPAICPGNEDRQEYQPRLDGIPIAQLKAQMNLLQNESDRLKERLEEASLNTHKKGLENEKLRLGLNDLKYAYDDLDIQYHQATRRDQDLIQNKIDEVYGLEDELKRLKRDNRDTNDFLALQAIYVNSFKDEWDKLKCKCSDLCNICNEYLYLKDKAEKDNATSKKELEALKATIAKQKCIVSDKEDEIKSLLKEMDTLLAQRETERGQTDNLIAELALKEKQLLENDKQLKELDKLKTDIFILKGLLDSADLEKKHLFSEIKDKDKMLKLAETRFNSVEDEMRAELESEKAANDNLKSQGADRLKQIQGLNRLRQKSEENANLFKKQNIDMRVDSNKLLDQISLLKDKEQSYENLKVTHTCMCLEKELLESEVISKIVEMSKTQSALSLIENQNEFLLQRIAELEDQNMELRKQQLASTLPDEARRRLEEENAEAERLRKEREATGQELQQRVLDEEKQISERLINERENAEQYQKDKDERRQREKSQLLHDSEREKEGLLCKTDDGRLVKKSYIISELEKLGNMDEIKKEIAVKDNKIKLMNDHINDLKKEIEQLQNEMDKCLIATRECQGLANKLGSNLNNEIIDLKNENKYLLEEMALMQAKLKDSLEASELSTAKAAQLAEERDRVQRDLNCMEKNLMKIQARKAIPDMDTTASISDLIKKATDAAEMEEKKAKELKNELERSKQELGNFRDANKNLMDDYANMQKELERINNEIESLKKDLFSANGKAEEAINNLKSKEDELQYAKEMVDIMNKEKNSVKDQLKSLKESSDAMEREKNNMASDKAQMYEDFERAQRKMREAAKDIENLQVDNKSMNSQIEKLKQLLQDAESSIENLTKGSDDLKRIHSKLAKENDRMKSAQQNLESELLDMNRNLAGAKSKEGVALNASENYENELRKLKAKLDDLGSLNKQLVEDKKVLENSLDDVKAVLKVAQDKYQEAQVHKAELDKAKKRLANADLIAEILQKEKSALDDKINDLRNTVNTHDSNNKNAQKNNEALKGNLRQLRKEMEALKATNSRLEKRAENTENAAITETKQEKEFDDLRSQLDKALVRLAELNSLNKDLKDTQEKLEKQAVDAYDTRSKLQKQVAILKGDASKEDEIKTLTDRLQQAEHQKNKYANNLKEYKKAAESKPPDLAKAEADCAEKLAALKAQYVANIKQMKKEHEEGVRCLLQLHDEAIKDMKRNYENEVENLHKQLEGKGIIPKVVPEKDKTQAKREKKGKVGICKCTLDDAFGIPCSGDKTSDPSDAEDLYVKEISYKILDIGLDALSQQELAFIHRKTCRSIKDRNAKKIKGQALNLKIQTLESSLFQVQQLTQQRMVLLERIVQQERQRLEEARAARLVLGSGNQRPSPCGHHGTRAELAEEKCKNCEQHGLLAYEKRHNQYLQTLLDCQGTCSKEAPVKPEED